MATRTDLVDPALVDDAAAVTDAAAEVLDAPDPQPLQVAADIAGSESIRARVLAHVEAKRWANPEADLNAPVPLDRLATAIASDTEVLEWMSSWRGKANKQIRLQVERACVDLPDSHIVRVVDAALTRLGVA